MFTCFVFVVIARTVLHAQSSPPPAKAALQPFSEKKESRDDSSEDETPTPAAKSKRKKSSPTPTPKPKKTPAAKKSPRPKPEDEDDEASATPAKKKPSPAKSKHGQKAATATPKPKLRGTKAEEREETPAPRPTERLSPDSTSPPPRGVAVPSVAPSVPPAEITVQKSGLEENQGFEPPPPPPPRRSFLARLFGARDSVSYRYLSGSVVEAIRRAPVQRGRWKFIVVHNSGTRQGNARAFDYYHRHVRHMQNGLAYHFVIGNGTSSGNGQIEVGDRWRRQINGGHVHSDYLNNIALGICLVGDFNRDQPSNAQLNACDELIRYLRERCGRADGREIPVRPHREMNPPQWATDCPGDSFPYGWFRKF
ncbi:MAG: peptidoglycan recognition family protein [Chthoniobacterales bacterium]